MEKKKYKPKNLFKKGNVPKGGRPKMTEAEKELSLKSRTQFKAILDKYMVTSEQELEKLYASKNLPVIDGMVIRSMLNTFRSGTQDQINWFLDHCLGKPKETTNIKLEGSMENKNSIDLKSCSAEELLMLKKIAEKSNGKN